jgi:hypothetical protein
MRVLSKKGKLINTKFNFIHKVMNNWTSLVSTPILSESQIQNRNFVNLSTVTTTSTTSLYII